MTTSSFLTCWLIWLASSVVTKIHLAAAFTTPEYRGTARLFLDTADTEEWDELLPTGIFHGITTNPTLLERAGEKCTIPNLHRLADKALSISDEFMCQAWGSTVEELFYCGMALSAPDRKAIVIKVPVTPMGVQAASKLIRDGGGCRVCLTACYDRKQALLATHVGAEYIAPYLGRMSDAGKDGTAECVAMEQIVSNKGSSSQQLQRPRILVASIRDVATLADLAAQGLDTFTISPAVARALFNEPLTEQAATEFEQAAARNL